MQPSLHKLKGQKRLNYDWLLSESLEFRSRRVLSMNLPMLRSQNFDVSAKFRYLEDKFPGIKLFVVTAGFVIVVNNEIEAVWIPSGNTTIYSGKGDHFPDDKGVRSRLDLIVNQFFRKSAGVSSILLNFNICAYRQ